MYGLGGLLGRLNLPSYAFGQQGMPIGGMFGGYQPFGGMFGGYQPPQQFQGNPLYQNRLQSPGAMDSVTQLLQQIQGMRQNRMQAQPPKQNPLQALTQLGGPRQDGQSQDGQHWMNGEPVSNWRYRMWR